MPVPVPDRRTREAFRPREARRLAGGDGLCRVADDVVENLPRGRAYLADQLQRASTSVPLNVAEGDGIEDLGIGVSIGFPGGSDVSTAFVVFGRAELEPSVDVDAEVEAGRAVRFERSLLGFPNQGNAPAMAPVGDLTGDGIDDLAIAFPDVPSEVGIWPEAGEIVYIEGRPTPAWPAIVDLTESGVLSRIRAFRRAGHVGRQMVSVGDVNGDGFDDLLCESERASSEARASLLYGSPDLPAEADLEEYISEGSGVRIDVPVGRSGRDLDIGTAGDVNRDGFADILLGAEGGGVEKPGRDLCALRPRRSPRHDRDFRGSRRAGRRRQDLR